MLFCNYTNTNALNIFNCDKVLQDFDVDENPIEMWLSEQHGINNEYLRKIVSHGLKFK